MRLVNFVKTWNLTPPLLPRTLLPHLGKIRLHMVFTLFVNSLKKFFKQTKSWLFYKIVQFFPYLLFPQILKLKRLTLRLVVLIKIVISFYFNSNLPGDWPPCGFLKNVSSIERVEPWFFVTFNIILKHIFPENFIEFPQVVQKIWRNSLPILAIFVNFPQFCGIFDITLLQRN